MGLVVSVSIGSPADYVTDLFTATSMPLTNAPTEITSFLPEQQAPSLESRAKTDLSSGD